MSTNQRPFTCYFCNKSIERETESSHVSTCGAVLEPCPNKCGSYIARNIKIKHLQECSNRRVHSLPRLVKQKRLDQTDSQSSHSSESNNMVYNGTASSRNMSPHRVNFQSINHRRRENSSPHRNNINAIHNENFNIPYKESYSPPRDNLNAITSKCLSLEQAFAQLQKSMNMIDDRQERLQSRVTSSEGSHRHNEKKILHQIHALLEWKKNVDMQFDSLSQELSQTVNNRLEMESKWSLIIDDKMKLIQELLTNLNSQKDSFLKEQIYTRETQNELQAEVKKFETFYTQENAAVCALWSDQGKQIDALRESISALSTNLEDQRLKHSAVIFDLRAISQVSSENAEKLEILQRELKDLKKSFVQLKVDVEMLEESSNSKEHIIPGRIIWKITDFALKMETAKSNNFLLKSPVFYSHSYGYKVRLVVYLNGIKKWKGRHLIAYLHVLKGDYDLMLPWPCNIDGNVIVRDLQDYATPRNLTKYITAKRLHAEEDTEEPQESSSQYIFIPHTQLLKSNYVKNDILFIEIKLNSRKYQDETSL